jgi:hypothetical protein
MPEYFVYVDLNGAGDELDRLARGPDARTIASMEAALLLGYTLAEAKVHIITGHLAMSGHPMSAFDTVTWTGEIDFARFPGIYELARGDSPTKYHPAGGHYFFNPGGHEFEKGVRQAFWDWVTDYKGGPAPDGGLPWASGGD